MSRLETLLARAAAEKDKAAMKFAKPVKSKPRASKVKSAKPAPIAPDVVRFDPKPSLLDAVKTLTQDELRDTANQIRAFNMLVLDEILRYQKQDLFKYISDNTLRNMVALSNAKDIRVARELCYRIVDACESSYLNDGEPDGSALRRLAQIERAIEVKSQQKSTGGANVEC